MTGSSENQRFTYGIVSEGLFVEYFAEILRNILRGYLQKIERVRKFCRKIVELSCKFSDKFLQRPVPERPHKWIAERRAPGVSSVSLFAPVFANTCAQLQPTPPCKITYANKESWAWGIIFRAIAEILRNRVPRELFSRDLRKLQAIQHGRVCWTFSWGEEFLAIT